MPPPPPSTSTIYHGTLIDTPTPSALRIRLNHILGVLPSGTISFVLALPAADTNTDTNSDNTTNASSKPTQSTLRTLITSKAPSFPLSDDTKFVSLPDLTPSTTTTTSSDPTLTTFLTPGLIDTHTHASQYPNVGIFGSSDLLSWLSTYTFPLESSFTPSNITLTNRVYSTVVSRTLSNGTTAAAYYGTAHVDATNRLAEICYQKGQRALVGRVCMDRMSPGDYRDDSASDAVAKTTACVEYCRALDARGEWVRPCVTPRFALSCTHETMSALSVVQNAGDDKLWAQTHISENVKEVDQALRLFPESKSYAGVYDDVGMLNERMILAHAIHLSPEETRLIAERGTKVSHCPASNSCLASGAARVKELMRQGVDVSLGTDMSGGYSPSVLEMVRQALLVSRHVAMGEEGDGDEVKLSVSEGLWLATVGGAKCMGLEDKVGVLEEGYEFDAVAVGLDNVPQDMRSEDGVDGKGPVDVFGWESWDDLIAKWVYCGDDRNVAEVWVKGRSAHRCGRFARDAFTCEVKDLDE